MREDWFGDRSGLRPAGRNQQPADDRAGGEDRRGPDAPEFWRRYLALVIDGLRTPAPHPLPPGVGLDEIHAQLREARARAS